MYRVIEFFHDLEDKKETKSGTIYAEYDANNIYPREGFKPSEKRIEELLTGNNKRGIPLIEKVEDQSEEPEPVTEAEPTEEQAAEEPDKKPRKKPAK